MPKSPLSPELLNLIENIRNKRARVVIDHIVAHGFITTEDLEKTYGYSHPPRAARDVREAGVPLETFKVKSQEGKSIAAYRFGDLTNIRKHRLEGRRIFPKRLKMQLYEQFSGRCTICNGHFEERYLQIDHRVPYEISGDRHFDQPNIREFMLLCASCNRAKSWSCEHCANWISGQSPDLCMKCYWGSPENYDHIALQAFRRLDLLWQGEEISVYEALQAISSEMKMPDFVKRILKKHIAQGEDS